MFFLRNKNYDQNKMSYSQKSSLKTKKNKTKVNFYYQTNHEFSLPLFSQFFSQFDCCRAHPFQFQTTLKNKLTKTIFFPFFCDFNKNFLKQYQTPITDSKPKTNPMQLLHSFRSIFVCI